MTALLDRIKAHSQPERRRRIDVPEWSLDGGVMPFRCYYSMVTLDDHSQVNDLARGGDLGRIAPYLVVLKATDEAGQKHFKMGDATWLRENAAPEVLQRIALGMLARLDMSETDNEALAR